jgi:anaerobic nitric oxide reductase transcription regulator
VYPLRVPPLRERKEDIVALASHFADAAARRIGVPRVRLSADARERLVDSDWPGNVRELENVVSRAALRASAGLVSGGPGDVVTISAPHLDVEAALPSPEARPGATSNVPAGSGPLRAQVEAFERRVILDAVAQHGGNWAAAARALGVHRSNLHHLARRLGLNAGQESKGKGR